MGMCIVNTGKGFRDTSLCGDTLSLWRSGPLPQISSTFHLAVIDSEICVVRVIPCGSVAES